MLGRAPAIEPARPEGKRRFLAELALVKLKEGQLNRRIVTTSLAALATVAWMGAMSAPAFAFLACAVTDTGGVDDKGFNQYTWQGVQDAAKEGGFETKLLESKAETDYVPNLQSFVQAKCDVIVTVGFLLGDATKASAEANPEHQVHHRRLRL